MVNNKEMIKEDLKMTIDRFYKEHKLPTMNISDNDWNSLLDVVEAHYLAHNCMKEYNHSLNIIIRKALYLSIIKEENEFNISDLIMALNDLTAFNIPGDEIRAMQEELTEKVKSKTK